MTFGEFRFIQSKKYPGVDADVLDDFINTRLAKILDRRNWTGLVADAQIVTVAAYQGIGTVNLLQGSNSVAGTGVVFTPAMTGYKFRAIAGPESYTFTYVDALDGTLERPFEGLTNTVATFILYQDTYDLAADYKQPMVSRNERRPSEIVHWTRAQLDRVAPSRQLTGEPGIYCIAPNAADGTRQAQLYPIPAYAASYPYSYIQQLPRFGSTDTALDIPEWISLECLGDFIKADIKGDKAAEAKGEAELLRMMVRDVRLEGPKALRIAPQHARHRLQRTMRGAYIPIQM